MGVDVTRPLLSTLKGGAVSFPLAVLLLSACAGPSTSMRKKLDAKLAAGDYAGAEALIQGAKLTTYGEKNRVLYHLDLGTVEHDARQYKESDQDFAAAENDMDQLYTKSLHRPRACSSSTTPPWTTPASASSARS